MPVAWNSPHGCGDFRTNSEVRHGRLLTPDRHAGSPGSGSAWCVSPQCPGMRVMERGDPAPARTTFRRKCRDLQMFTSHLVATLWRREKNVAVSLCISVGYGWEAGIRTPISRVRVCCPTVERPPSTALVATNRTLKVAGNTAGRPERPAPLSTSAAPSPPVASPRRAARAAVRLGAGSLQRRLPDRPSHRAVARAARPVSSAAHAGLATAPFRRAISPLASARAVRRPAAPPAVTPAARRVDKMPSCPPRAIR